MVSEAINHAMPVLPSKEKSRRLRRTRTRNRQPAMTPGLTWKRCWKNKWNRIWEYFLKISADIRRDDISLSGFYSHSSPSLTTFYSNSWLSITIVISVPLKFITIACGVKCRLVTHFGSVSGHVWNTFCNYLLVWFRTKLLPQWRLCLSSFCIEGRIYYLVVV